MRRAQRSQCDDQLAAFDLYVCWSAKQLVQKSSSFVLSSGVLLPHQNEHIALGLVGNHLHEVRQVLALGGELDHSPFADVSHLDPLRQSSSSGPEPI